MIVCIERWPSILFVIYSYLATLSLSDDNNYAINVIIYYEIQITLGL